MEGHQFFDAKESMGGKMGHQSFGALSCLTRFFVFISKGALEMKIIFFPKYVHCPHVLHKTWFKIKGTRTLVPLIILNVFRKPIKEGGSIRRRTFKSVLFCVHQKSDMIFCVSQLILFLWHQRLRP